jgi:hypothetical protein
MPRSNREDLISPASDILADDRYPSLPRQCHWGLKHAYSGIGTLYARHPKIAVALGDISIRKVEDNEVELCRLGLLGEGRDEIATEMGRRRTRILFPLPRANIEGPVTVAEYGAWRERALCCTALSLDYARRATAKRTARPG